MSPVVTTPTPLPAKPQAPVKAQVPATTQATIVKPEPEPLSAAPKQEPTPPAAVNLTRPKWVPKYPKESVTTMAVTEAVKSNTPPLPPAPVEQEGFTLRFESDQALTRLVAMSQVGFYAIEAERARRMTISESRISFWDASTPNSFHEMEVSTVPASVVAALSRTGANPLNVAWGVTLPGKLKQQLDSLMQNHSGGSLVITSLGQIQREES